MESPDNITGPVNWINPHEVSIGEIARRIIALTNSKSELVFMPLPEDDSRQRQPDISYGIRVLGCEPRTPIDVELTRTIAHFDSALRKNEQDRASQ